MYLRLTSDNIYEKKNPRKSFHLFRSGAPGLPPHTKILTTPVGQASSGRAHGATPCHWRSSGPEAWRVSRCLESYLRCFVFNSRPSISYSPPLISDCERGLLSRELGIQVGPIQGRCDCEPNSAWSWMRRKAERSVSSLRTNWVVCWHMLIWVWDDHDGCTVPGLREFVSPEPRLEECT